MFKELIDWNNVSRVFPREYDAWDRRHALMMMAHWNELIFRKLRDRPP